MRVPVARVVSLDEGKDLALFEEDGAAVLEIDFHANGTVEMVRLDDKALRKLGGYLSHIRNEWRRAKAGQ